MPVYKIYSDKSGVDNGANGVAVSSTNTYYSNSILIDGEAVSWHFVWTGTPTGTFTLQYSNKPDAAAGSDTDWVEDTSFPAVNPAGAASKAFISASQTAALYCRLKYVNASGSGTIKAWAYTAQGRS